MRHYSKEPQQRFFTVRNGARVRCLVWPNPKSEKAIVLCSGWVTPPELWRQVARRFSSHATIIVPENLGHGDTTLGRTSPRTYMVDCAQAFIDIMNALHIKSAYFFSHSMAGQIVKHIFEAEPDRVNSAIFVCTPLLDPLVSWYFGNSLPVRFSANTLAFYAELFPGIFDALKSVGLKSGAIDELAAGRTFDFLQAIGVTERNITFFVDYLQRTSARAIAVSYLAMRKEGNHRDQLPRISRPSLYIAGGRDWVVQPRMLEGIAQDQGARFSVIEEGSHTPYATHLKDFLRVVTPFLREVGAMNEVSSAA